MFKRMIEPFMKIYVSVVSKSTKRNKRYTASQFLNSFIVS